MPAAKAFGAVPGDPVREIAEAERVDRGGLDPQRGRQVEAIAHDLDAVPSRSSAAGPWGGDPRQGLTTGRPRHRLGLVYRSRTPGWIADEVRESVAHDMRGLRTIGDFEYQMALTNRHLKPDIETVFVMPSHAYSYVSSSLIKDIVRYGGDVSTFVTPRVVAAMQAKLTG